MAPSIVQLGKRKREESANGHGADVSPFEGKTQAILDDAPTSHQPEVTVKRRPGRPPGAKNKPKVSELASRSVELAQGLEPSDHRRRRGRPPGSKNKPKASGGQRRRSHSVKFDDVIDGSMSDAPIISRASAQRNVKKRSFPRRNIYEAVAGRYTKWGRLPMPSGPYRDKADPNFDNAIDDENVGRGFNRPATSTEVIANLGGGRKRGIMPKPNPEDPKDVYDSMRNLPPGVKLPDSDLLKAIHQYASDFYDAIPDGYASFRTFEGTALMAFGILLEELSAEALGENGHMVFTESVNEDMNPSKTWLCNGRRVPSVLARARDTGGGTKKRLTEEERQRSKQKKNEKRMRVRRKQKAHAKSAAAATEGIKDESDTNKSSIMRSSKTRPAESSNPESDVLEDQEQNCFVDDINMRSTERSSEAESVDWDSVILGVMAENAKSKGASGKPESTKLATSENESSVDETNSETESSEQETSTRGSAEVVESEASAGAQEASSDDEMGFELSSESSSEI